MSPAQIKPKIPQSNVMVERFNRAIAEAFYKSTIIKELYSSRSGLQDDLGQFITHNNFKRTNQDF